MALILIADDSPTEVFVIQQMLEKHGHQILVATDGGKAIQLAEERHPDLILMDVVMPNMNGFQATRKLSHSDETIDIPIVMISSKDQETDKIWGMRQGAKGYLAKPVTEAELVEQVNAVLGG
jgi:twitching motility two-component system response regulator PilH